MATNHPHPAAAPAAPAPADSLIMVTPHVPIGPLLVMVVGAGGNGARVIPPLCQMLRPQDAIAIVDDDIVEDRNLRRQHFTANDVGQRKAVVLANRYRRPGRNIHAYTVRLTPANVSHVYQQAYQAVIADATTPPLPPTLARAHIPIFIGCTDNAAARRAIRAGVYERCAAAWIDVGNELQGGQMLLSLQRWKGQVLAPGVPTTATASVITLDGMAALPQLLKDRPGEANAESCGERLDMQTVQVNHLAAAAAINALSWLMLGISFTNAGTFFSTLNTMQPIKIARAQQRPSERDVVDLIPDTTFAEA